jgi:hypothetical protein
MAMFSYTNQPCHYNIIVIQKNLLVISVKSLQFKEVLMLVKVSLEVPEKTSYLLQNHQSII